LADDILARIRLIRSSSIGPVTYRQLIARFGNAQAALDAIPDLARRGGGKPPRLCGSDEAERERAKVERLGARYLMLGQGLYPPLLAELDDAPPLLIAKGDLNLLDRPSVAIVGARNASAAACRFARSLAHDLGNQGLVVVSGLARGIDSAAHDGALESGTTGVIAGGNDVF
jgi:DNA processing protein